MQPQKFQIESYEQPANGIISLMLEQNDIAIPITIPQDKFEWWLRINDKLEWELNLSDHTGEHKPIAGTLSLEEYWHTNYGIEKDLYEYIADNNAVTFEGSTFSNSMESLLLAFEIRCTPYQERWEHDQEIQLLN